MKKGINKTELIKSLENTLKLTRIDIEKLELKNEETVVIYYETGYRKSVNIACDSGIAIIKDVVSAII